MTNDKELDKDRLFFTQCNDPILLRCLVCTREKKFLGHCKVCKNFPSLWCHIKQDHSDLRPDEIEEIIQILNNLFKAFQRQMFPKWAYYEIPKTTTSSFLIAGRKPRSDRREKLEKIAKFLKMQSELFPKFKPKDLKKFVQIAIGPHDPRIIELYFSYVIDYSKKDKIHGLYDVTDFCDTLGV